MRAPGTEEPVSLEPVRSEAIRWVIDRALADGNRVVSLAQWSKALVAHMEGGLSGDVREATRARWPQLEYFRDDGSPHNEPDEGFIEDGFAVSFPRRRGAAD